LNHAQPAPSWIKANWFAAAIVPLLAADLAVLLLPNSASPRLLEVGLLSDLCIVLPGLYLACYWRKGKRSVFRAIALASIGFWVSSKLLPESSQFLVQRLWPFRYVALAVIVSIEFKVMLGVYRAVFSGMAGKRLLQRLSNIQACRPGCQIAAVEASLWSSLQRPQKPSLSHGAGDATTPR
jgi:hypothetical protein